MVHLKYGGSYFGTVFVKKYGVYTTIQRALHVGLRRVGAERRRRGRADAQAPRAAHGRRARRERHDLHGAHGGQRDVDAVRVAGL